ncbi:HNH endonuclease signature motif containing protein [Gammaproteobacteria bacterium AS21]
MNPKEINYSSAYSFADAAISAVRNPSDIAPGDIIADFFEFRTNSFFEQIEKPQQYTLLHTFIYNINCFGIQHYLGKVDGEAIISDFGPILDGANIPRPVWFIPDEVESHINELRPLLDAATRLITEAVFQMLFANRTFLFEFNKFLSPFILGLQPHEHPCIIAPGVVKRAYFPVWLKNAIFHRDKGRCQLCGCDLTNIMVPTGKRHIDHMVPLRASGTNDPTNFQLTCESCNTSKGAKVLATNHLSYTYW